MQRNKKNNITTSKVTKQPKIKWELRKVKKGGKGKTPYPTKKRKNLVRIDYDEGMNDGALKVWRLQTSRTTLAHSKYFTINGFFLLVFEEEEGEYTLSLSLTLPTETWRKRGEKCSFFLTLWQGVLSHALIHLTYYSCFFFFNS